MSRLTIQVPESTHKAFKAFCAADGSTMSDVLSAFMADLAHDMNNSGGSDERRLACEWYQRNEPNGRW